MQILLMLLQYNVASFKQVPYLFIQPFNLMINFFIILLLTLHLVLLLVFPFGLVTRTLLHSYGQIFQSPW